MVRISLVFAEDMTASGEAIRRVTRESMGYPGYPGYHSSKDPQMIGSLYGSHVFLRISWSVFEHLPSLPSPPRPYPRFPRYPSPKVGGGGCRGDTQVGDHYHDLIAGSEDFRHIFSMKNGRTPWRLGFWALKLWTSHLIKNMFASLPGARYHSKWVNMTHFMGGNSLFLY